MYALTVVGMVLVLGLGWILWLAHSAPLNNDEETDDDEFC